MEEASSRRALTAGDWAQAVSVLLLVAGTCVLAENVDALNRIKRFAFMAGFALLGVHFLVWTFRKPGVSRPERAYSCIGFAGIYAATFLPGHHLHDMIGIMSIVYFSWKWIRSLYLGYLERKA